MSAHPIRSEFTSKLPRHRWVPETRFGHWFLGTNVWKQYVVEVALNGLARLLPPSHPRPRRLLDLGCGPGVSLPLLDQLFQPDNIIGLDIDPAEIIRSQRQATHCRCRVEVRQGDATRLDLANGSIDLVLCHQTLHHVVQQQKVLEEIYRVLAPGGVLLLAESCRVFIHSAPVRFLFRHPNEVQKSATEYQTLVRQTGFQFSSENVITSTPFWSLPDWGLLNKLTRKKNTSSEPTEISLVAFKPPSS